MTYLKEVLWVKYAGEDLPLFFSKSSDIGNESFIDSQEIVGPKGRNLDPYINIESIGVNVRRGLQLHGLL